MGGRCLIYEGRSFSPFEHGISKMALTFATDSAFENSLRHGRPQHQIVVILAHPISVSGNNERDSQRNTVSMTWPILIGHHGRVSAACCWAILAESSSVSTWPSAVI